MRHGEAPPLLAIPLFLCSLIPPPFLPPSPGNFSLLLSLHPIQTFWLYRTVTCGDSNKADVWSSPLKTVFAGLGWSPGIRILQRSPRLGLPWWPSGQDFCSQCRWPGSVSGQGTRAHMRQRTLVQPSKYIFFKKSPR